MKILVDENHASKMKVIYPFNIYLKVKRLEAEICYKNEEIIGL
jgi:hypothetical protein